MSRLRLVKFMGRWKLVDEEADAGVLKGNLMENLMENLRGNFVAVGRRTVRSSNRSRHITLPKTLGIEIGDEITFWHSPTFQEIIISTQKSPDAIPINEIKEEKLDKEEPETMGGHCSFQISSRVLERGN